MMYAKVIPDGKSKGVWYEVVPSIRHLVHSGSRVYCNSADGLVLGEASVVIDGVSDDVFEKATGFFPEYEVVAVIISLNINDIYVPESYNKFHPSKAAVIDSVVDSLVNNIGELYHAWCAFRLGVEADGCRYVLRDNYAIYRFMKRIDFDRPECIVSGEDESIFDVYGPMVQKAVQDE